MRLKFLSTGLVLAICMASGVRAQVEKKSFSYQDQWISGRPDDPGDAWAIAYGGRLYDHWANTLEITPPRESHPSYPAAGKARGATTWRCKECHGWDYQGAAGAYATGGSYTGIKGIRAYAGAPVERIARIVRDSTHRYTPEMIPDDALQYLAIFVSKGQFDTYKIVDRASGKITGGNPGRGKDIYQNLCAICHGFDGRAQNLGTNPPVYVGTVANTKPWELLHKVRNGFPGMPMPSNIWWDMKTLADVAAYAQGLPQR